MGKSVENPKKYIVSCRVDDSEMQTLQIIAEKSGVSISMLLRQSLDLLQQDLGFNAQLGA